MAADRLNYNFLCGSGEGAGVERAYYSSVTVTQNVDGSNVQLHVPAIPNHFLDTSEFYVRVALQVVQQSGEPIASIGEDYEKPALDVFPLSGFLNNLWSQCNVRLNGHALPPGNDYPYLAQLLGIVGASQGVRTNVLQPLSGGVLAQADSSSIGPDEAPSHIVAMESIQGSKELVLYGRIQSDVLLTLAQLLPDTMDLDIELIRGRDSFALGSTNPDADYRIRLNSVTLFVKRVEFNQPALVVLRKSLQAEAFYLKYQRYQTRVMFVPRDSKTLSWGNVFSSGALPKRVFFFLVDQRSYSGAIDRRPTFCETARVAEVRFLVDGRDLLPEPYRPRFMPNYGGDGISSLSNVRSVVLGFHRVMGTLFHQSKEGVALGPHDMLQGIMIYAGDLNHSLSDGPRIGNFDVALTFRSNIMRSYTAFCIGEFDQCIKVAQGRDIYLL